MTGASSGIGYAIAEELTKQGVNVIGCARRAEKIEDLANKCANYTPGKDCSQGGCGKITAIKYGRRLGSKFKRGETVVV